MFFYFVTCPCNSRTKRHDNLFVDDDDDDDETTHTDNKHKQRQTQ